MSIVQTPQQTEEDLSLPYLVFKVMNNTYAVNCRHISSIMQYKGCEALPSLSPEFKGIVLFQSKAAPVVDMRTLLGQRTLEEEYREFAEMLDARRQDHIHWVNELERSIEAGERFGLATDPHQCAFGKWYDSYQSDNNAIMFHLWKIKEPHERLHQAAEEVIRCKQQCDSCERETCLKEILHRAKNLYMPAVLKLLEEAKAVFQESYVEMLIILGEDDPICLMVDQVVAVEDLEKESPLTRSSNNREPLLTWAMRSKRTSGTILLLDDELLLERYRQLAVQS